MDEVSSALSNRLVELAQRIDRLERRMRRLEDRDGPRASEPSTAVPQLDESHPDDATTPVSVPTVSPTVVLAWVGRTLVILGGAFLLRALTESQTMSRGFGTAVGFTYALLWFFFADRDASRRRTGSANFYALTAAVIAFPLVWEAVVRFALLQPFAASSALLSLTAIAFAVAWRRELSFVAWMFGLGTVLTSFGLAFATKAFFPFFVVVLSVALASLWMGYARGWRALARLQAVLADLAVLLLTSTLALGAAETAPVVNAKELIGLQLSLMLAYLCSFAVRTLVTRRDVGAFVVVQSVAALGIGFGGAVLTSGRTETAGWLLATLSIALAATAYAMVFAIIDRRLGSRTTFVFYSTVALILTVAGCNIMLSEFARVAALGVAAILVAWLGAARSRATLSLHGAIYATTAAIVAGLFTHTYAVFVSLRDAQAPVFTAPRLAVLAVVGVSCLFPVAMHGRTWGRVARLARLTHIALLVMGVAALIVGLVLRELPPSTATDAAVVGVIRTAVMAGAALLLGWLGASWHLAEVTLLVPPILVLGGVKLVFEDLRTGRPLTLFASLVLYGVALIVGPRMLRRNGSGAAQRQQE